MKNYGDDIWEKLFSTQVWGRYPSEEAIRFFMRMRAAMNIDRPEILDIGCGKGALCWFFAKEGARVTAIDGAPSGVNNVRSLAAEFGADHDISVVLGDITMPKKFINGSFDMMIDHYALFHNRVEQIQAAFRDYYDLLKPGGCFLSCCLGKDCDDFGIGKKLSDNTYVDIDSGAFAERGLISFFSREEINKLLVQAGFSIVYEESLTLLRNGSKEEKLITCVEKSE